jgi:succinoglycan biosynthesis protein ExoA
VLVVIPCLNEATHLRRLVERLVVDVQEFDAMIVIADGGSTDGTVEIAEDLAGEHPRVVLLHNPGRIQSSAINLAVERFGAEEDFLIRVDAHADYPDDFCARLVASAERSNADSVVVAMNTVGDSGFQHSVARAQNSRLGNGGAAHRNIGSGRWVDHGHHALMRLSSFREIGGYDSTFSHNEDVEYDIRLGRAGGRIWLTDEPTIDYYPRATASALLRQYANFGRGVSRTRLKHRVPLTRRQAAPMIIAPAVVAAIPAIALAAAIPGGWAFALLAVPAAAWALACAAAGIVWRDPGAGVALGAMHLGWSLGFWAGLLRAPFARRPVVVEAAVDAAAGRS